MRGGTEQNLVGAALHLHLHRRERGNLGVVAARVALHLDFSLVRLNRAREAAGIGNLPAEALAPAGGKGIVAVGVFDQLRFQRGFLARGGPDETPNAGHAEFIAAALVAPPNLKEVVVLVDGAAVAGEGGGGELAVGEQPIDNRVAGAALDNLVHLGAVPAHREHALAQFGLVEPLAAMHAARALEVGGAERHEEFVEEPQGLDARAVVAHHGHGEFRLAGLRNLARGALEHFERHAGESPRKPVGKLAGAEGIHHKVGKIHEDLRLEARVVGRDGGGVLLAGGVEERQLVRVERAGLLHDVLPPFDFDDGHAGVVAVEVLRGQLDFGFQLLAHLAVAEPAEEACGLLRGGGIVGLDGHGLNVGAEKRLLGEPHLLVDEIVGERDAGVGAALKRPGLGAEVVAVLAAILALAVPRVEADAARLRLPLPDFRAARNDFLQLAAQAAHAILILCVVLHGGDFARRAATVK